MSGISSTNQNVMITVGARDLASPTLNRLNAAMSEMAGGARHLGVQMTVAGTGIKYATKPILDFFSKAMEVGVGFEDQMARTLGAFASEISSVSDRLRVETALMDEANRVGVKYALSNIDAAEALEMLGKFGRSTAEAIGELESVVKFSEANNYDLEKSAKMVAVAMNVFSDSGITATEVVGNLTGAAKNSGTDIEQIAVAARHGSGAVASMGYEFNEFATVLGIVADRGVEGAMAGTQLRSFLTRLVKPTAEARALMSELGIELYETGSAADATTKPVFQLNKELDNLWKTMTTGERTAAMHGALQAIGVSLEDVGGATLTAADAQKVFLDAYSKLDWENAEQVDNFAIAMGELGLEIVDTSGKLKSFPEIAAEISRATDGMSESQRNAVLTTLATQRGFQFLIAMLGASGEEWDAMAQSVDNGGKQLETMMDLIRGTVGYSLEVLAGNLEVIQTILFGVLKGPMKLFVEGIIAISEAFVNSARPIQVFVTAILGLIATLGAVVAPLMLFIGMLMVSFGSPVIVGLFLAVTAAVAAFGVVIAVIIARVEDFKKAIEPAILALRMLNDVLSKGPTEKEGAFFERLIDWISNKVISGIAKLARGFQILIDIIVTFRQAMNGEWVDHPEINRVVAVFGTLGHVFRNLLRLIGKVVEGFQEMKKSFDFVREFEGLANKLVDIISGNRSKGKEGFADTLIKELENFERKIVSVINNFDSDYLPRFRAFGRDLGLLFIQEIAPAIEDFKTESLMYLEQFADWFTGKDGGKILEWLDRFAKWAIGEGIPNSIENIRWVLNFYIDLIELGDDVIEIFGEVWEAVTKAVDTFMMVTGLDVTWEIIKRIKEQLIGSTSALDIFNGLMRALLALRVAAFFYGIAASLVGVIGKFALLRLAFPLRILGLFTSGLFSMVGAFRSADKAKDKHITNQGKLRRVLDASARGVRRLASALLNGLVAAFGAASESILYNFIDPLSRKISDLLDDLRNPAIAMPGPQAVNAPLAIPESKTVTLTQRFLTIGTSWLEEIGAVTDKYWTFAQRFFTIGTPHLDAIAAAADKTVTITQNFKQTGNIIDVEGRVIETRLELAEGTLDEIAKKINEGLGDKITIPVDTTGESAGKSAAGSFVSGFLSFLAGASLSGGIRGLLTKSITMLAGKGVHGTVAALVLAIVLAIVLLIQNPEYITRLGNAIGRLLDGGLAYALGYATGTLMRWAISWADLMNGAIESALSNVDIAGLLEKIFALSFPGIAIAIKMPEIMEALEPIRKWIEDVFNTAADFITGPALTFAQAIWNAISTALSSTWTTVTNTFNIIWEQIVITLTQTIPDLFSGIGQAIWDAIGTSLSTSWETFKQTIIQLFWELPQDIINTIRDTLGPPLQRFFEALFALDLGMIWQTGIDLLVAIFITLPQRIWEVINTHFETIRTRLSVWWDEIKLAWQTAWEEIGTAWDTFTGRIKETASTIWEGLTNAWDEIKVTWQTAWDEISEAWDGFVEGVKETASDIWDDLTNAWEGLKETATGVIEGIESAWDGFASFVEGVIEEVLSQFESYKQGLEDALGEENIQRLKDGWEELKGIAENVWSTISEAVSTAAETIGTAIGTAIDFVTDIATAIYNFGTDAPGDIESFATAAGETLSTWASTAWDTVSGFVTDAITELGRMATEAVTPFVDFAYEAGLKLTLFAIEAFNKGKEIVQNVIDGITFLYDAALQAMQDIIDGITGLFTGASTWLEQAGKDIVQGLADGITFMKDVAVGALETVVDAIKKVPGYELVMRSPSKVFEQFGKWIIEGLAIGITEEQATAAKAMSDAIGAVVSAAEDIYKLSDLLRTERLMPIDPEKMKALAQQGAEAFFILRDALADISGDEETAKAYSTRVDSVTKAVDAFTKIFELLKAIADNEAEITGLTETFGVLKLALERAIDELHLMFSYLGDEKLMNSGIAIASAEAIGTGLTAIVELLVAMSEWGGYVNFEGIGQLKLALERAIDELHLMFSYLGTEKISNATTAISVAKDIGEGFSAIIDMVVGISRLGMSATVNIDEIGQLKLVLERAIHELALMFNFFQEGEITKAGKAAAVADEIGKGFEAIVKFIRLLSKNSAISFDVDKIEDIVYVLEVSVKALGDAFLRVGQPFIDNAKVFAESGKATAIALIETFKFLSSASKVGVQELPPQLIDNLVAALTTMVQKLSAALSDINYTLLEPSKQAAETGQQIAESLLSIFDLFQALGENPTIVSSELAMNLLIDTLISIMKKFDETLRTSFGPIDEETLLLISAFGESAEAVMGSIGAIFDVFSMTAEQLQQRVDELPSQEIVANLALFIDTLVSAFEEVAVFYAEEALTLTATFAETSGSIIDAIGAIPDALTAIATFKAPSEKKVAAVINFIRYITEELIVIANDFEGKIDESAKLFIETSGAILDAFASIPDAMEGVKALIPMTESKMSQIKDFFIDLGNTFLEIARSFTEADLLEIQRYVETVSAALDMLNSVSEDVKSTGVGTGNALQSAGSSISVGARTAAASITGGTKTLQDAAKQLNNTFTGGFMPDGGMFPDGSRKIDEFWQEYGNGVGKYQIFPGGLVYMPTPDGKTPYTKALKKMEEEGRTNSQIYKIMKSMEERLRGVGILGLDQILEQLAWAGGINASTEAQRDAYWAERNSMSAAAWGMKTAIQRLNIVVDGLSKESDYWRIGQFFDQVEKGYGMTKEYIKSGFFGMIGVDMDNPDFPGGLLVDSRPDMQFVQQFLKQHEDLITDEMLEGINKSKHGFLVGGKAMKLFKDMMHDPNMPWNMPEFTDQELLAWVREKMLTGEQPMAKFFNGMEVFTREQIKKAESLGKEFGMSYLRAVYGLEEYRDWIFDRPSTTFKLSDSAGASGNNKGPLGQLKDLNNKITGQANELMGKIKEMVAGGTQITAQGILSIMGDFSTKYGNLGDIISGSTRKMKQEMKSVREDIKLANLSGASFNNDLLGAFVSERYIIGTINLGGVTVTGTGDPLLDGALAGQAAMQALIEELEARNT